MRIKVIEGRITIVHTCHFPIVSLQEILQRKYLKLGGKSSRHTLKLFFKKMGIEAINFIPLVELDFWAYSTLPSMEYAIRDDTLSSFG